MEHICGKDGRPHNSTARNKQNALCNGRSIWDVVKSSEDFKKIQQQPANPVPKAIQFSYIQERKPRFVVLLENSDNLSEKRFAIPFALRRFYYDLPPGSKLALYTYNSEVTEALSYKELSAEVRSDLGAFVDFGSPAKSICTSCGLAKATQILLQNSEVERGSILLITASPLDKVPELSEKLKESGICLHVLRFTDKENPDDQTYDALASSFHCFSQESLHMSLDVVSIFNSLSRFLKNPVPELNDDFEFKTVASGNMSAQIPVTIPRYATAEFYTLWLGRVFGSGSIECKAGDADVELKPDTTATDIVSFTFDPVDDDVTCRLGSAKQPPVLTQVQMTTEKGQYFDFDIWIHDVSTDKEQLPILIYAKIYFREYPVKEANVTVVVTSGNRQDSVKMLDNGRGDPDVTQHDGIYSGYFTNFLEKGDYQITVNVNDNEGQAKIGKDSKSLVPDACCGSKILSKDYNVPDFWMDKLTVYTSKNKRPEDGYPPSRILDLEARIYRERVLLKWTAPEGGKAVRYVIKLFENKDDAVTKFDTTGRELNASIIIPRDTGEVVGFLINFTDLNENVTYYVAIRSRNEFNKWSEISNVAEFVPKQEEEIVDKPSSTPSSTTVGGSTTDGGIIKSDPTKNSSKTIAIVLGVLGGIAVVCILVYLGYYFFVKKPRRN
ncbi:Calcium-activated chloride channel regulator 3A-1 [Araneus ventricosus]|uniref:Calcium-activated chloride channel regulator 3A-1 n=1 Tax=Araneus ventricosus TaxID=182803 RepID=A0A4Y2JGW8_ARAVE|nr:Calcium-activated chloride channel regulator 3A-1 [Araneus ventricosus]